MQRSRSVSGPTEQRCLASNPPVGGEHPLPRKQEARKLRKQPRARMDQNPERNFTMTTSNTAGRGLAIAALALAASLLGLQILGGIEYTHGGSLYTIASMIAAMVTLAALPVFIETARRHGYGGSAITLVIAFAAFLAYSLPATTGRTGEIKEVKAQTAADLAPKKIDLATVTAQLDAKTPRKNAECNGAPDPLPPRGWPVCRTLKGETDALQAKQTRLQSELKGTAADQLGDMGSDLWAWALSPLSAIGLTIDAATIRKASIISFAIGLDLAIWPLVALGFGILSKVLPTSAHTSVRQTELTQLGSVSNDELTDFRDRFVSVPEAVSSRRNDKPNNGGLRSPRTEPKKPNGSGRTLNRPGRGGFTKDEAAADLVTHLALGGQFASQNEIAERYGIGKSTASEWLKEWESDGLIPARTRNWKHKALAKA